ncbi:MAG: multicopper oxidase domain-containing protein [Nocardioidaceae bacterium]
MSYRRPASVIPALLLVATVPVAACSSGDGTPTTTEGVSLESGVTRTYYISADPVVWDYAPQGKNEITGRSFGPPENVFVQQGGGRVGSRYLKCLYRGYTDGQFTTTKPVETADAYLGDLGPVIRAEVGDTIKVVFRNECPFPTSMHPHGVRYDKASEGAPYNDGSGQADPGDAVATGHTVTYVWHAEARSGPGPMDGSSAGWMYHSHVDEVSDVYAGLTGFLVITARGEARPDGSPADVDREIFSLFEVDDENSSPLLSRNVRRFAGTPVADPADEEFVESNLMHSMNGYVYGNGPVAQMRVGERVRWYVMGMGTEVDLHTPHWHGNTVTINGMRTDVANLLPASMVTADMTPDAVGTWLYHCHVGDHIAAGMQARYQVTR